MLETPWFGYSFGLAAVLLTSLLLELLLPQTRLGNASTLLTIPVLFTAAVGGRGPALLASVAALVAFEERQRRLGNPPELITPVVFVLAALVAGQLAATLRQQAREAQERKREVIGLQQLGGTLLEEHDFDRVLHAICLQLKGLTGAEGVVLALLDPNAHVFELHAGVGPATAALAGMRIPAEGSFAGEAVRTNQAQRSNDLTPDRRGLRASLIAGAEIRSVLSVPMRTREATVGAMSVYNKPGRSGFTDRDVELATVFAQQAAVAIENARLYENLRDKAALEERQRDWRASYTTQSPRRCTASRSTPRPWPSCSTSRPSGRAAWSTTCCTSAKRGWRRCGR
jgi:K+-sensing histidine kinase KdpD